MNQIAARLLVWGVTVTLFSGCMGGMSSSHMQGMEHSQMQKGSPAETPQANMGAMEGMTSTQQMSGTQMAGMDHNMKMDPNKPLDAQFIDSMIVHHQGAVEMANEVLQKAEHTELKTFAEAIIAAQTQEIGDMQGWRKAWYPKLADTGGMAMAMGEMAVRQDPSKPYDQRFLEAMIAHHQGAIDMANMALQMNPEHPELKTLSEAIIKAQQSEIAQMKAWLQAWYNQQ